MTGHSSDEPESGNGRRWGVTFTPRVDLGHLLQALVILVGAVTYLVGYSSKTDEAIKVANDTKIETSRVATEVKEEARRQAEATKGQLGEIKSAIDGGLREIRNQIASLPDVTARLNLVERRLDSVEASEGRQDGAIGRLEQTAVRNGANIDNLMRGTAVPLHR